MADALMDRIKAHRSAPTVYDPPTFEQMADRIEELVKERDDLGRKLNTARYGQPDFAWSIHEKEMAALRAKLTKAEAYLQKISRHANRSCSAIAARALAELEGK